MRVGQALARHSLDCGRSKPRSAAWRPAIAVGLLAFAFAVSIGTVAADAGLRERVYEGGFINDPDASIHLGVTLKEGVARKATFEASNLQVRCEGDPVPRRMSFPAFTVRLLGSRHFEGRDRLIPQEDGFRYLYKFGGRLLGGGRAKGFVFYFEGDFDPPAGNENFAECSTDGLLRWRAERVR